MVQVVRKVSARVIINLRRLIVGENNLEYNLKIENIERRFRLVAVTAGRGEALLFAFYTTDQ
ncbi:MAG: hypothetical protein ACSLEM_01975 [Candidatus Malihini olakiniferum]